MRPKGPLMREHRLIEKVVELIGYEIIDLKNGGEIDPVFIDAAVDFFRTYADRTHHGKEEDILFRDLEVKDLEEHDRRIMNELAEEHEKARSLVGRLVSSKESYEKGNGDGDGLQDILVSMASLVDLYPGHIMKEDEVFFPDSEKYLSDGEMEKMLTEFNDFDREMIHERYGRVYEALKERNRFG